MLALLRVVRHPRISDAWVSAPFYTRGSVMKHFLLFATWTMIVAGCGTVPARPAPVIVEVPVFVPITAPVITNMDILRASCWPSSDAFIIETLTEIDSEWWIGLTFEGSLNRNLLACADDPRPNDCLTCFDTLSEYIYFVWH